jgi:pantetheine-phosphate adenylyltransferase
MALTNRKLNPEIDTLFMMPSENLSYVSASMVRELIRYNGDYTSFVTPIVADRLKKIQEKS